MSDDADARRAAVAVERSRRIGQLWLEQLDDLEATAREHAGRSADSARLLAAVTAMMEEAQDFCARMFDPATAPHPEGKADER